MDDRLSIDEVSGLFKAVLSGLRVASNHQDRAYSLEEVSERTGFALSSLIKDCRAGRLNHVHYGDFRGMTPLQVAELLRRYSSDGDLSIRSSEPGDDIADARASSARAARRLPRRRVA